LHQRRGSSLEARADGMTIFNFYLFSKRGSCLYAEWLRPRNPLASEPSEDRKLMFGLVHSLKLLMNKLSPR
jgi:hypothetical protein